MYRSIEDALSVEVAVEWNAKAAYVASREFAAFAQEYFQSLAAETPAN